MGIRSQRAATIMAPHRDPYRMEKYRPEAEWLAASMERIENLPVHVRGIHYAAIGTKLPNGMPYMNLDANYVWLQDKPAQAARWLRVVPFTSIIDRKNDEPQIFRFERPHPERRILLGDIQLEIPDDLAPEVSLADFRGVQAYRVVLVSEKTAVVHVVKPIAERLGIDLYLETGEISNTHLHDMAAVEQERSRR